MKNKLNVKVIKYFWATGLARQRRPPDMTNPRWDGKHWLSGFSGYDRDGWRCL